MYGLKQAAILAYQQLVTFLTPAGYMPVPNTTGMWKHRTRKTVFCICVDDFGIKYFNKDDIDHLLGTLEKHYTVTTDWTGRNYCGLTIDWEYNKQYVDISMPGYIEKVLHKYQHPKPAKPEYSPHDHVEPIYGAKRQFTTPDSSAILDLKSIRRIQGIVGSLLFYGRAIDNTMLTAINEISGVQNKATQKTLRATNKLLDYAATYPNTKIRFYASDMVLYAESDAAYLVQPNAKSRASGFFYLSAKIPPDNPLPKPPMNGPILIVCKTIRHVVASSAEAETSSIFINAREAVAIRQALIAMGHPQPPTPLKTDNSTALGFIQSNIKQKLSKSWDMRLNWLRDRELMKQFYFYWDKGGTNNADYHSKHHRPKHHRIKRHIYVHDPNHIISNNVISHCANLITKAARVC
jgi:hypothetical protein